MAREAIVIGSGPAGVHAARALLDRGWGVTIVDGGHAAPEHLRGHDPGHFEDVRRNDPDQWRWFLGDDLSNIPLEGISGGHGGGMASGNRSYVTRDAHKHLPVSTTDAFLIQSLAQGGLGAAWGATCAIFDENALRAMGVPSEGFADALANVIADVGVSGTGHPAFQPPLPLDHHASGVLERKAVASNGVRFFQPPSAVLTKPLGDRRPNPLTDMDYYADAGRSVYRPQWTLRSLMDKGARYEGGYVVTDVRDGSASARPLDGGAEKTWRADAIVMAAGAVNTGRILLRSMGMVGRSVPVVVKPHDLVACFDRSALGHAGPRDRVSLCQLVGMDATHADEGLPSACAQLYSYRSLMLFRLLSAVPLPAPVALPLLALLSPALVIADVRYPGYRGDGHAIALDADGRLSFTGMTRDVPARRAALVRMRKALNEAGLTPVKTMASPVGSTSHYAGTAPVSDDPSDILRCDPNGRVHGFSNVYVADASMFRCLPPLPHTLTLMANAYRVGRTIAAST